MDDCIGGRVAEYDGMQAFIPAEAWIADGNEGRTWFCCQASKPGTPLSNCIRLASPPACSLGVHPKCMLSLGFSRHALGVTP